MSGNDTTIVERELPDELAERFATIVPDRAPSTIGERIEVTVELIAAVSQLVDLVRF